MIRNFLLTLRRNKVYGVLNIIGLSIGIACAILIFLWVEDEVTYDHNFKNRDRLYRVMMSRTQDGRTYVQVPSPPILTDVIKREIPEVKDVVRLTSPGVVNISKDDKQTSETGCYCDSSFFSMFSVQFVNGNQESAFRNISSVVLSEKIAKKLFGKENPLGKSLTIDKDIYTVTAVVKGFPENTSLYFDWLIPLEAFFNKSQWGLNIEWAHTNWTAYFVETIVELHPLANVKSVNKKIVDALESHGSFWNKAFLFNMNDWRLYSSFDNNGRPELSETFKLIRLLSLISFIIILLACINFMNLATARAMKRAKEVGVLKALGFGRIILIRRFLGETMMQVFVSLVLSVMIVMSAMPLFNQLTSKNLSFDILTPAHVVMLIAVFLFCGLFSGLYPAFLLSSFKPVDVLMGLKLPTNSRGTSIMRKALVVFQFSVSVCMIVCILVIYGQFLHAHNRDWGYRKEGIVTIPMSNTMLDNSTALLQEVKRLPVIENAGITQDIFNLYYYDSSLQWQNKDPQTPVFVYVTSCIAGVFSVMGIELEAGRDFSENVELERDNVIINQSLAQSMGAEGRVGGEIKFWGGTFRIIGIAKNYIFNNYNALRSEPLMILCQRKQGWQYSMYIKVHDRKNIPSAIKSVEAVFKPFTTEQPFTYGIFENKINRLMFDDMYTARLLTGFCFIAILISCFGLLGLIAFAAAQRTREIGIRKVFGASNTQVALLLSKDFLILVGIACVIAFPVAGWIMKRWLENYEYRIGLYWWIFALAGIIAVVIAWGTVGMQAIKAASANPVDSIKAE